MKNTNYTSAYALILSALATGVWSVGLAFSQEKGNPQHFGIYLETFEREENTF